MAHSNDLHQRAKQFKAQQNDVDRRLMIVTQSETSDDAVQKFDHSMESLRKLDVAQGYMKLLSQVENLRFANNPKPFRIQIVETFYAALKHAAISTNLLKMPYSHTSNYNISLMLLKTLSLLPKMQLHT